MSSTLTYFPCTGYWFAIEGPELTGSTSNRRTLITQALVDIIPRVPAGFVAYVDQLDVYGDASLVQDTAISIPTLTARIWEGKLSTINVDDTPGVQLLADTAVLGLIDREELSDTGGRLIYDVRFREVVYNLRPQALSNFGFYASQSSAGVVLTDESLDRLPYGGPR